MAITALFGEGDKARVTLIQAWMDEGIEQMYNVSSSTETHMQAKTQYEIHTEAESRRVIEKALLTRLKWNEHAYPYLREVCYNATKSSKHTHKYIQAFALLITPDLPAPPLDPRPLLAHVANIADTACYIAKDTSVGVRIASSSN